MLANPLTGRFGVAHGQAVGMMLPHVICFNGAEVGNLYFELLECTAGGNGFPAPSEGHRGLADFIAELLGLARLASRLGEFAISPADLAPLPAKRRSNGPPNLIPVKFNRKICWNCTARHFSWQNAILQGER